MRSAHDIVSCSEGSRSWRRRRIKLPDAIKVLQSIRETIFVKGFGKNHMGQRTERELVEISGFGHAREIIERRVAVQKADEESIRYHLTRPYRVSTTQDLKLTIFSHAHDAMT